MSASENEDSDLKMQIIFGSPPDKILSVHPALPSKMIERCLNAWRLWSIRKGQELRRANRLALTLRLRSLLRAWRGTVGLHGLGYESIEVEMRAQKLLREHQERRKAQYVRERMLHLRAACLCKMRAFRWTAKVARLALLEWHLASKVSRLTTLVYVREKQESLRKIMKCLKAGARNAQSARSIAQKQQMILLSGVMLSWHGVVQLKAQKKQHFQSNYKHYRNLKLKHGLAQWQNRVHRLTTERRQKVNLICNHRLRMLSNAFTSLKEVRYFLQKTEAVIGSLRMQQAQRGLQALKMNVDRLKKMQAVLRNNQWFVFRNKLMSWNAVYRSHGRVARLSERQRLSVERLLGVWLHGCLVSEFFYTWKKAVEFAVKETRSVEFYRDNLHGKVRSAFQEWMAITHSLKQQRRTRLRRFQVSRLGQFMIAWKRHLVAVRVIEVHRKQQLANGAKRILRVWQQNCQVLQTFRGLCGKKCLQLCAAAFSLWSLARHIQFMEDAFKRRLQSWALSSWAEWATLRRQVRDDVAWQRWADGIVDLFTARRLLLGLPTCFASWNHFYRWRQTRHRLALNKQLEMDRQTARMGLVALRRNLALSRFAKVDTLLRKVQRTDILRLLLHLRKLCCIASKSEKVIALHQRFCKDRALRGLHRLHRRRNSSRKLAKIFTSHLQLRCLTKMRYVQDSLDAATRAVSEARQRRCLMLAWMYWLKGVRAQVRREWLPTLFDEWCRVCKSLKLQRRGRQRQGLRRWKNFVQRRSMERRQRILADLLYRRRLQRAALLPWQLATAGEDSLSRLKECWSNAEVPPGLRQIGFMSYKESQ